jgi:NAD(P)-dependent dehydrogenase (short-subunit alcohol dehydrogenase family)
MRLKDKVALVTGACQGMGRAIALGLAGAGAQVVVNDIQSGEALKDVLSALRELGRESFYAQGDVSSEEDVQKIISATMEAFGRIDVLVNNAGLRTIAYVGRESYPVVEMEVKHWDRILAVNLRGPFLLSKAVLPYMIKQKQGSIINISSGAAHKAVPGKSAYSASKHALEGLTKSLAGEVSRYNIRVNALEPGGRVDVDGRGGLSVDTIVPACVFLASDDAQAVSGQSIIATQWNEAQDVY